MNPAEILAEVRKAFPNTTGVSIRCYVDNAGEEWNVKAYVGKGLSCTLIAEAQKSDLSAAIEAVKRQS